MKGLILPFVTTLAVVLTGVLILLAGIILTALIAISSSEVTNRFVFVSMVTAPYDRFTVMSELVDDDRTLLERSLHTSVAASVQADFSDLLLVQEQYDYEPFFFSVYTDERIASRLDVSSEIVDVNNLPQRCGPDEDADRHPDGFCVPQHSVDGRAGVCGVGRVTVPGEGVKVSGHSALIRHSKL